MPETGRSAKGFQDSAVQSAMTPHGAAEPEDGQHGAAGDGAKAATPPAETDEPDRMAIVELETKLEMMIPPPVEEKAVSPYPDFPETNPFRLAAREVPVVPAPAGPAVRPREHGDGRPPASSLAHRRGSPSELKVLIPPAAASG